MVYLLTTYNNYCFSKKICNNDDILKPLISKGDNQKHRKVVLVNLIKGESVFNGKESLYIRYTHILYPRNYFSSAAAFNRIIIFYLLNEY